MCATSKTALSIAFGSHGIIEFLISSTSSYRRTRDTSSLLRSPRCLMGRAHDVHSLVGLTVHENFYFGLPMQLLAISKRIHTHITTVHCHSPSSVQLSFLQELWRCCSTPFGTFASSFPWRLRRKQCEFGNPCQQLSHAPENGFLSLRANNCNDLDRHC